MHLPVPVSGGLWRERNALQELSNGTLHPPGETRTGAGPWSWDLEKDEGNSLPGRWDSTCQGPAVGGVCEFGKMRGTHTVCAAQRDTPAQ